MVVVDGSVVRCVARSSSPRETRVFKTGVDVLGPRKESVDQTRLDTDAQEI